MRSKTAPTVGGMRPADGSAPDAATGENRGTTYTDGVGAHRCTTCGSLLRAADDQPWASMRVDDLEEIACLLVDYVDCPAVWAPTIKRLEQAVGRTVGQMKADARAKYLPSTLRAPEAAE